MDIRALIIVVAVFGILEFILCRFIQKPWIRFALPLVLLVLSASLFIYGRVAPLEGMKDLAYMLMGVFIFFGFLSSSAVALVFSIVKKLK
jgi:hypothetical protein